MFVKKGVGILLLFSLGSISYGESCLSDYQYERKYSEVNSYLVDGLDSSEVEALDRQWVQSKKQECNSFQWRKYKVKLADAIFQSYENGLLDDAPDVRQYLLSQLDYYDSNYGNVLLLLAKVAEVEDFYVFKKEVSGERFFRYAAVAVVSSCNEELFNDIGFFVETLSVDKQKEYRRIQEKFSRFEKQTDFCE